MGKRGNLSNFKCAVLVGGGRADLNISETADLLEPSHTTMIRV